ncbi:hypothetical protein EMCRGX_G021483 [Ephydatia muelleri]
MSEGLPLERKDAPQSNVCSDGYSTRTAPFTVPDGNGEDDGKAEGNEAQGVRVALIPNKARSCHDDAEEQVGESEDITSLLSGDRATTRCPSCYRFWRSYRSSNPQSSITPVAIVILIVLFVIYVLNQADKLVLAVLIPAGLRCEAGASNACPNVTSNVTANSSAANSSYYGSLYSVDINDSITNDTSVLPTDCIHFTDDEQGIMTGPAFTVVYVVAGLPMARLADTRSRSLILLAGLAFWSVVMLLMGFVSTFWELLLLRVLLGVGEASCSPVAYSLLSDFFPPQHRAFALSIYHFGVYAGGGFGWMSGAINVALNWRWTFRVLGVGCAGAEEGEAGREDLLLHQGSALLSGEAASVLASHTGRLCQEHSRLCLGGVASHFHRTQVQCQLELSSRWKNGKAYFIAASQLIAAPCIAATLLVSDKETFYWLLLLAYITAETWLGPAAAIAQDISLPAMRAQVSAVYIGLITIVASIGPVLVPALFSVFSKCDGGVGHALLVTVPTLYALSSVFFVLLGWGIHCWGGATEVQTCNPWKRKK